MKNLSEFNTAYESLPNDDRRLLAAICLFRDLKSYIEENYAVETLTDDAAKEICDVASDISVEIDRLYIKGVGENTLDPCQDNNSFDELSFLLKGSRKAELVIGRAIDMMDDVWRRQNGFPELPSEELGAPTGLSGGP